MAGWGGMGNKWEYNPPFTGYLKWYEMEIVCL